MKPVVLRLDSGGLIGTPSALGIPSSEPIVRLSAEEAARIGRLDYKQVIHARKLLKQAAEELGYDLKNCPELETDEDSDEVRTEALNRALEEIFCAGDVRWGCTRDAVEETGPRCCSDRD